MHLIAKRLRAHTPKHPSIYVANLVLSFHYAVLIYVNSSFLELHLGKAGIGLVYFLAAVASLAGLVLMPKVLRRVSNGTVMLVLTFVEFFAVTGLVLAKGAAAVATVFIVHEVLIYLMYYSLDLTLESVSDDKTTGGTRGAFLTVANLMFVASPLVVAALVAGDDYRLIYLFSALLVLPLYALVWLSLSKLHDARHREYRLRATLKAFAGNKDLMGVFVAQFILNFFYAWMTVYMPIYLNDYMGFSWQQIGVIFTVMLVPFVLFEIPVGRIADEWLGEKELMATGFILMAVMTYFIPSLPRVGFAVWAFLLFMSRVGASFVEATTESYFFKHVNASRSDLISFFRVARPLAYGLGPLAATVALAFLPMSYIFTVLACVMLLGVRYSLSLKDTK